MAKMKKEEVIEEKVQEAKYRKGAFLKSSEYKKHSLLLTVLLKDEELYTKTEVNKLLKKSKEEK